MSSMQPQPEKSNQPATHHKPRLYGDPDPSIQPTLVWGSGSVTITGIPSSEGGHPVSAVLIDGASATLQSNGSTWTAATAASEEGNSMSVVYAATLVYANMSFPRSTPQPLLRKQG